MRTDTAKSFYLKDYRAPDYLARTVDLRFVLHPEQSEVTATVSYERRKGADGDAPLVLDGDGLELVSASLDGKPLAGDRYSATPDRFTLASPPQRFTLKTVTRVNPGANTALSGLYLSGGNYCTQCEAEGFRRITYFTDRPDVMAVYSVRLEADAKQTPLLLSNGNPGRKGKLAGGRHFAEWHDPHPKPSYLFALVAGDLGSIHRAYVTSEGRKVKLGIHVQKGKENQAGYAMDALVRSMRWDEEVFGCAYDLDVFNIVAVPDFNMGAMENKGLNIFNDKYVLASPETATDTDYARIEGIVAHEYFHNWTGNRITCRDWFQLCLKEGLTVYRDQEFSADMRSRAVKRIEDVSLLRAHQFPEDAGPLAHPVRPDRYREINNFYTATVYEKGAELVRMIATLLGPDVFMKGMRRYLSKHDGEAATIEQFIACFEAVSKRDLSRFFLWYTQAGTPVLHVATHYDRSRKTFAVDIEQSQAPTPGQARKKPLHMPLAVGLVGSVSKQDLKAEKVTGAEDQGGIFELSQRRQKITFHGIDEKPVLSINRGFSAPVEIDYRHLDRELGLLAAHDSDLFMRWQSFRLFASRQIFAAMRSLARRKKPVWKKEFLDAAVKIAENGDLEPAFRAMALTLPSETELARLLGRNINPDAIYKARRALSNAVGEQLEPLRETITETLDLPDRFEPSGADAGKRELANRLLAYGVHADSETAEAALVEKFRAATNMTDREFAFRLILQEMQGTPAAEDAVTRFHERYRDDPIVLDKWFAAQAAVSGRGAVATCRKLVADDAFNWTNPNRVRSVIGTFSSGNPTGFNRADGAGYRFIIDAIRKLDAINPQVAARLLTAFRSWRMLEPERRKQAQSALRRLKKGRKLSRDSSEILDRMLS
ncbi:aminopeptidase N [Salaquimonas pukyongi]|uniref:aminopeptidase N n=1 Tax=Salaquimonas pukyongi TaxID=2712698 RepID=UPI00096BCAB8|nr:aminopeptidase N [Salaquimonas pukyongi]